MASVPGSAAPSLFLRNATGLVKGWSGFDAFAYSFMSVNLVTLGMFYSLAIFAYVPDGSAVASIIVTAIGMTFMVIAYAGLIAVMPRAGGDYVWQTRVLDGIPGAVTGGASAAIAFFLVGDRPRARATRSPIGGAIVGALIGGDDRPEGRRRRVRPVGDRLVVHPRALGADLRLHPQDRVRSAARRAPGLGRGRRVLRHGGRDVRGVDRHDHHHVRAGRPGDGGLRQDPALVPVHRPGRPRPHVRPDARSRPWTRSSPPTTRRSRACSACRTPTRRRSTRPPRIDGVRLHRLRARPVVVRARHAGARALHAVLDPVPELGRDPLRRGPRGG